MYLNPYKPIDRHTVNLPHWQQGETWIFVTWRLADSLPKSVVEKLNEQKKHLGSEPPAAVGRGGTKGAQPPLHPWLRATAG
jgi:hypothetical protein